jgi:hypothetical protein
VAAWGLLPRGLAALAAAGHHGPARHATQHAGHTRAAAACPALPCRRFVALLWLLSRKRVAQLGYILTCLTVTYMGMIWQQSEDLATPAVALFMMAATELFFAHRAAVRARGN